jgi:hypothetical protein
MSENRLNTCAFRCSPSGGGALLLLDCLNEKGEHLKFRVLAIDAHLFLFALAVSPLELVRSRFLIGLPLQNLTKKTDAHFHLYLRSSNAVKYCQRYAANPNRQVLKRTL